MNPTSTAEYDVLVVGSGIGGMESALKLGDMGYKVLLVEKEASVGGKMILLSKVFPTLDCASCISTPKMAATIHHPNITALTYSEVEAIRRGEAGTFQAHVLQKARFVDEAKCTGCALCEPACTVAVPDNFNAELVPRRAAYIPFPQAVPKKAVIERAGTSPCSYTCPAGIPAHGYVSLIRGGEYEKAFRLVLDATPLVGSLGRACYAPCEADCSRGDLEGPLPIRKLKRFVADRHYAGDGGPGIEVAPPNGKKVAIVGSGPAGLTAAWQLARKGYGVRIFEAAPLAGGFLRLAIPSYRLPAEVVDDDVANLTAIGVGIETETPVTDLGALHRAGYDAILVATGTPRSARLGVPGEDLNGVTSGLDLLRSAKAGKGIDVSGKHVVVVGGGNVAMDAARTALRLGARETTILYRRGRAEMPAHSVEVDGAEREGVVLRFMASPISVQRLPSRDLVLRCVRMRLGDPDASGRARPEPVAGSEFEIVCGAVVSAVGLSPDTSAFGPAIPTGSGRTLEADPETLQTAIPYVFAAGDVVSGATDIARAVGAGRRAAFAIDHWLQGQPMAGYETRIPPVEKTAVFARQRRYTPRPAGGSASTFRSFRRDFAELEPPMTQEEAHAAAARCLDCGVCSECGECVAACPADAIDLRARDRELEVHAGAVVVSTGFKLFAADLKPQYGYGTFKNVITGMQMDRLLAPTRPFNTILRPGDGKVPERIAYVMCTGSRDETVGNPLCSRFCCMYSVKQNQLIMGALPLAEVTVHYMDIRAPGKRYDEFYEQAKAMGATYIKGRVARITEKPNGDLVLRYEDIEHGGAVSEAEYDLVVLAVGVQPNGDAQALFPEGGLALDPYQWVAEADEDLDPGRTAMPGVFVAGAASGPKDIADSIVHADSTVAQVAAYLQAARREREKAPALVPA